MPSMSGMSEIEAYLPSPLASLVAQLIKNPPAMPETWVLSLGWEDPLQKRKGYPLQYSGLENCMDCIVHGVANSRTRQSEFHFTSLPSPFFSSSTSHLLSGEGNGTPLQYSCLGKSHGLGSLVGCSPQGPTNRTGLSDFTFTFHFHALEKEMATHSSVLAWRIPGTAELGGLPAVYGVAQSRTRLKRLSSSSSWVPRLTSLDLQTNCNYECALGTELVCI